MTLEIQVDERFDIGAALNGDDLSQYIPESFTDPRHACIASTINTLLDNFDEEEGDSPISIDSVARELEKSGQLEQAGGVAYLSELAKHAAALMKEAYDWGYREGTKAQAGSLLRVQIPDETYEKLDEELQDGTGLLLPAYCEGWDTAAKDVVREVIKTASPEQILEAVFAQWND